MENKINLPPFYVGQRVVCINDRPIHNIENNGKCEVKRNSSYVISGLRFHDIDGWFCAVVGIEIPEPFWGFHASRFAPIEHKFQSISFEKVIEKEKELIGVN